MPEGGQTGRLPGDATRWALPAPLGERLPLSDGVRERAARRQHPADVARADGQRQNSLDASTMASPWQQGGVAGHLQTARQAMPQCYVFPPVRAFSPPPPPFALASPLPQRHMFAPAPAVVRAVPPMSPAPLMPQARIMAFTVRSPSPLPLRR